MPVYNQVSPLDSPLVEPMEAVSDGVDGYTSSTTDYFRGVLGDDHSDIDLYNGFGNFGGYTGKTLINAHDTFIRSLKSSGIWGKTYDLVLFFGHKERKDISLFLPLEGTMLNTSPLLGRHIDAFQGANNTRPTLSKSSPVQLQRQRTNGTSYSFLGGAGNITGDDNKQTELRSRHRLPSSMTNGICMSAYVWNQGSYDNGSGSTNAEFGFSGNFMGARNTSGTKRLSFGGHESSYIVSVGGNGTTDVSISNTLTGVALHTLNLQSDNSYKIYKNGVEKYSGTNGDTSNLPVGEQMNHFWNGHSSSDPWDGFLSLTHYSEALTAQQVTALNSAVQTLVGVFD
jgi:hypothetical protein